MQIVKDTVVTLSYRVSDPDGNPIDEGAEPYVYLHGGYSGIFAKVEEALAGKAVGAELELKLLPEDAFGDYDAELVFIEPIGLFPEGIEVGMQFERATEEGEDGRLYTITDIAEDKVIVDGNHPLAGIALVFRCVVVDVRQATLEEITHGHVHGPHGHTHH